MLDSNPGLSDFKAVFFPSLRKRGRGAVHQLDWIDPWRGPGDKDLPLLSLQVRKQMPASCPLCPGDMPANAQGISVLREQRSRDVWSGKQWGLGAHLSPLPRPPHCRCKAGSELYEGSQRALGGGPGAPRHPGTQAVSLWCPLCSPSPHRAWGARRPPQLHLPGMGHWSPEAT